MGFTISYYMLIRNMDDLYFVVDMADEKAKRLNWVSSRYAEDNKTGVIINTNNLYCETISIIFEDLCCNYYVKYIGEEEEFIKKIFDLFWTIKPKLRKLMVTEECGLWEDYKACQKKTQLPIYRTLTLDEKSEISRGFDIVKSNHKFFSPDAYVDDVFGEQRTLFFQMMRKDLSDDLANPTNFSDIEVKLRENPIYHFSTGKITEIKPDDTYTYWIIIELWILHKLYDKAGVPINQKLVMSEDYTTSKLYQNIQAYSWMMMEFFCGFYGGCVGSKHSIMNALIRHLKKEGYQFNNNENFFRLAYSLLEYAGFYRKKEAITNHI